MDSYLENAMDYVQSTFENANEWLKAHDPLRFPEVEANINVHIGPNGLTAIPGRGAQSDPNFTPVFGHNNNPTSSYSGGGGDSFSPFGSGNGIGHGSRINMPDINVPVVKPIEIKIPASTRIDYKFDHMGNIVNPNPNFPNIYVNIPTPKQENQNANGDNTQAGGSSEESKQGENKAEKEAKLKKAEDELRELKERHLKILDDTSKSSNEKAEGMGKAVQDVAEKTAIVGAGAVGARAGAMVGGALGGPVGGVLGFAAGGYVGEKLGEHSVEKAKEIVKEHEKTKDEL